MRVTKQRRAVITALRVLGRGATYAEVGGLVGMRPRSVGECCLRMMQHGAVAARNGVVWLRPAGYVAVGSFPPKMEKEARLEDGKIEDQGVRGSEE